ncbi:MAG: hypothetical protein U0R49_04750 [Fimbriimonadales bacterium]
MLIGCGFVWQAWPAEHGSGFWFGGKELSVGEAKATLKELATMAIAAQGDGEGTALSTYHPSTPLGRRFKDCYQEIVESKKAFDATTRKRSPEELFAPERMARAEGRRSALADITILEESLGAHHSRHSAILHKLFAELFAENPTASRDALTAVEGRLRQLSEGAGKMYNEYRRIVRFFETASFTVEDGKCVFSESRDLELINRLLDSATDAETKYEQLNADFIKHSKESMDRALQGLDLDGSKNGTR